MVVCLYNTSFFKRRFSIAIFFTTNNSLGIIFILLTRYVRVFIINVVWSNISVSSSSGKSFVGQLLVLIGLNAFYITNFYFAPYTSSCDCDFHQLTLIFCILNTEENLIWALKDFMNNFVLYQVFIFLPGSNFSNTDYGFLESFISTRDIISTVLGIEVCL